MIGKTIAILGTSILVIFVVAEVIISRRRARETARQERIAREWEEHERKVADMRVEHGKELLKIRAFERDHASDQRVN